MNSVEHTNFDEFYHIDLIYKYLRIIVHGSTIGIAGAL